MVMRMESPSFVVIWSMVSWEETFCADTEAMADVPSSESEAIERNSGRIVFLEERLDGRLQARRQLQRQAGSQRDAQEDGCVVPADDRSPEAFEGRLESAPKAAIAAPAVTVG